jgi:hypothetical protein
VGERVVEIAALTHARAALAQPGFVLIIALSDTNKIIILGLCARDKKGSRRLARPVNTGVGGNRYRGRECGYQ